MKPLFPPKKQVPTSVTAAPLAPWKVIVADDDQSVHDVTDMSLKSFRFEGRPIEIVHAYSGAEAIEAVRNVSGAAAIILDVVMESEHAGLQAAKAIREEVGNKLIRIVLRTGQPGMAPETEVVARYDIQDYKEKTELSARKLFTLMHGCLRNYRDLQRLERTRNGLTQIIDAMPTLYRLGDLMKLASGTLTQAGALLGGLDGCLGNIQPSGIAGERHRGAIDVIASTGRYASQDGAHLPEDAVARILGDSKGIADGFVLETFPIDDEYERFVYLDGFTVMDDIDRSLVQLFLRNISIAFDNFTLKEEIELTQKEIVYRLGEAVECRSEDTGQHVKRVAKSCALIARRLGMAPEEVDLIEYASPLHDVGKIGIPDSILNKPGKLTADEWVIMRTHTVIGYNMLKDARQPILRLGARIALEHHERWDGTGYPGGLKSTAIDRFARIVSVVDAFDALGSRRPYKEPWPLSDIVAEIGRLRGVAYDPDVVDAALSLSEELHAVRMQHPDPPVVASREAATLPV